MPSQQDIDNQRQRLGIYRESVQLLLRQIAQHGAASMPQVLHHNLKEARAEIAKCKGALRVWGVDVDEHPDDADPDAALPSDTPSSSERTIVTAQGALKLGLHNELQALAELPEGSLPCIGETHLIYYTGPSELVSPDVRLALEHAYRSEVALRYAEWRRRYVSLPLQANRRQLIRGYEREQLFFEALRADTETRSTIPFADLREALSECGDMLLLGPSGAGKTTALWRLALDLAEDGLYRETDAQLPVFVRLGSIQEDQTVLERLQDDLATAVIYDAQGRKRTLPAHQALAPLITHLLGQGRLVLLWDGLNETPRRMFVTIAQQLAALPEQFPPPPGPACTQHLITCRADDHKRLVADCDDTDPLPLTQTTIQGLDQVTIQRIVLARLGEERGTAMLDDLEITTQRTLAGLARTPLLLTMLCVVYEAYGKLPDTRGKLLEKFVLLRMVWESQRTADWVDTEIQRAALARLAYFMTESQGRGTSVDRNWASEHLAHAAPNTPPKVLLKQAEACDLLELVAQGNQVRFTHQLIQEYFAALALRDELNTLIGPQAGSLPDGDIQHLLSRYAAPGKRTRWEETLLLLAGLDGDASIARQLVRAFLAQPLEAARLLLEGGAQPDPALLDEVGKAALDQIRDSSEPSSVRLPAGEALSLVGDPRLLDPRAGDAPVGGYWCSVEAGLFWFGEDDEGPLEQIEQPCDFKIARFLVTNAEYQRFIDAGGYDPQQPWWSTQARVWLLPEGHPYAWVPNDEPITQPSLWNDARFNQASQPVAGVSWYEAAAFCSWLTTQGHQRGWLPESDVIRLPTWREWQRAARHTDRRRYPWGDMEPDFERANYKDTSIERSSPVGCFPDGQAVCGALDMAGNVWEWLATPWGQPQQAEPLADVEQDDKVLIAGGAFDRRGRHLSCGFRNWRSSIDLSPNQGFRVIWAPRPVS